MIPPTTEQLKRAVEAAESERYKQLDLHRSPYGGRSPEVAAAIESVKCYREYTARLEKERDNWHAVVKDICDEWKEACLPTCDSFGHDEKCAGTYIKNAMKEKNDRIAALESALQCPKCGGRGIYWPVAGRPELAEKCPTCTPIRASIGGPANA